MHKTSIPKACQHVLIKRQQQLVASVGKFIKKAKCQRRFSCEICSLCMSVGVSGKELSSYDKWFIVTLYVWK